MHFFFLFACFFFVFTNDILSAEIRKTPQTPIMKHQAFFPATPTFSKMNFWILFIAFIAFIVFTFKLRTFNWISLTQSS